MLYPIQCLPPEIVNIIAAGEIIDSLASVVRELVDNSIDAKSTRISISLNTELWQISVTDNGMGMSLQDLRNCARAHHTNKIRKLDDLCHIYSLGFRGEALFSIANVGQLAIKSRHNIENSKGWCITYDLQGQPIHEKVIAIASGTTITISDIFGNMPVRRKGLPSFKKQLKTIRNIIENASLCYPHVVWDAKLNGKSWINISPGKTSQQIIPQLLNQIHYNDLRFTANKVQTPSCKDGSINIVIGLPDRCHRSSSDWIKIGINGRIIKSYQLEKTVIRSFGRCLPKGRFPICFLELYAPFEEVDWNRHPIKSEVYLHFIEFWEEQIFAIIEQSLKLCLSPSIVLENSKQLHKLLKSSIIQNEHSCNNDISSTNKLDLLPLKAVGQVNKTYIVAEHPNGLWLVEQHIAHERILYEKLQDEWKLTKIDNPIVLNLSNYQVKQLQDLGLELEIFGEQMWVIRTIPQLLVEQEDYSDILLELSLGKDLESAQVATACKSALRNGVSLELHKMQEILDAWKNTRNPRTCPHGRPIYLPLDESVLSNFFRRHWVIGKSHGI
ncbi:MAG: DNA mismatch repair protein MutL [Candidatus Atelocyanobacterium thalassa isolate SIO64986]|uniref:DNA mismatch repair protein MutL n=1 Tax=Candidatus Atelocyanobacterium thalassa isolate SIO64986 TaxID=1527444 RepID=A0A086CG84_9CHRO|nr:MAG: DNA mismatch repair protein MutL [Candidatus Atelocyanobacterium thalassa isolate SIO64986]